MARVRVFIEMFIDHKDLVNPESFPFPSDLFDLGKSMLSDDIQEALDEDGVIDSLVEWDIVEE